MPKKTQSRATTARRVFREGEIRIYYKVKGGSDLDLDEFLRLLLKLMGYRFFASGMDMETRVRDLCFEKKEVK